MPNPRLLRCVGEPCEPVVLPDHFIVRCDGDGARRPWTKLIWLRLREDQEYRWRYNEAIAAGGGGRCVPPRA